ncbi:MAG: alpha-2-macroglobulin family protein [Gammaproteobacteria bacterium]|nr:alpha-2-macroglobulin family protein [Gammaproteobacteria bacterium]
MSLSALILLVGGGIASYIYYLNLPEPLRYEAVIKAPGLTPPSDEAVPDTLQVDFQPRLDTAELQARYQRGAPGVARLHLVGKAVSAGIRMEPSLPGSWTWLDDDTLEFEPARDWPAGERYHLEFQPSILAEGAQLAQAAHQFSTPAFKAGISRFEFYQDPREAGQHKVVATLAFSHPVDPASLKKQVKLSMRLANESIDVLPTPQAFELSYSKNRREAYLHSLPLKIGEQENHMKLTLKAGVATQLGGTLSTQTHESSVLIPSAETFFKVTSATGRIVRDGEDRPQQALLLEFSDRVLPGDVTRGLQAWLLPPRNQAGQRWHSPREVTNEVLTRSEAVTLRGISPQEVSTELASFMIDLPERRHLYLRLGPGLVSTSGFTTSTLYDALIPTPAYPKEARILSDGSLMARSGDQRLSLLTRGIETLRVETARVLPGELNHLISQTRGDISNPEFNNYQFNADNLSERFIRLIDLTDRHPGEANYASLDLGKYLDRNQEGVGLFFVKITGWDRKRQMPVHEANDQRLILVSDLGLLVKDSADTSHDFFVQSITTGQPVSGARVELLGRNGLGILSGITGPDGHVHLPETRHFEREQYPTVYIVRAGSDVSFIPFERNQRFLNYSRFDVGGSSTRHGNREQLSAYLFSDRGIYRPGEQSHLGIIVRRQDFSAAGSIPLEAQITDPRGYTVLKRKITLTPDGFFELQHQTDPSSPTGTYQAALYLIDKRSRHKTQLGATSFRVEEFQPDRLKIRNRLSIPATAGWVEQTSFQAQVSLQNLFGAPAQDRRITAELLLNPAGFTFEEYEGFSFVDPYVNPTQPIKSVRETLPPQQTDAGGEAAFDLDLSRFERGTYRLTLIIKGFEAGDGRSVVTSTSTLVSSLSRLIGYKTESDLDYLNKDSQQQVAFISIDPELSPVASDDLRIRLIEKQFVSTLVKQSDGTYRFQSVEQRKQHYEQPFHIPESGSEYQIPTDQPGDFQLEIIEASGLVVSRVPFTVVGARNLAAELEKNAELRLNLNKADYRPGEMIEMSITAPYSGSGLITIERDRVYAFHWFQAETNSTVQHIRVPEDLEGNAYVNVAFIRGADSREIFTSPLSYGVQPFSIDRSQRTVRVNLETPELVEPGGTLVVKYSASAPARLVLFAIDEGILQVAGYKTPAPLDHFLRKWALEVRTAQIADLILPEFNLIRELSASGGGSKDKLAKRLLAGNLNPFARKARKPVAFWSGILRTDTQVREHLFDIPDTFNGRLRIMAVTVSESAMDATETTALVRGPFVLTPNVPTMIAPGDEFEVTVGIANALSGSGEHAQVKIELLPDEHIQITGESSKTLELSEGSETHTTFRLRALSRPGKAALVFRAQLGERSARITSTLSIRPPVPFQTSIESGFSESGSVELALLRELYPDLAKNGVVASARPLALTEGLISYLEHFPHQCTEQIISGGYPMLTLTHDQKKTSPKHQRLGALINRLRSRQSAAGGFSLWPGNTTPSPFPSVYAMQFLTDAGTRGVPIPRDMLERGLSYLRDYGGRKTASLQEARWQAQALYLLTRNGLLTTNHLVHLQEYLETHHSKLWPSDITAAYMAATYQLLHKKADASRLIKAYRPGNTQALDWSLYDSQLAHDAQYIYLLANHFEDQFEALTGDQVLDLLQPIMEGKFNTFSSAMAIQALDAYSTRTAVPEGPEQVEFIELDTEGRSSVLSPESFQLPRTSPSVNARRVQIQGPPRMFYQLTQSGFDRTLPTKAVRDKLEIVREYLDADGNPVSAAVQGDELTVRLSIRALEGERDNVAVIDLLPGGFEVMGESVTGKSGQWQADYTDIREDRVVFYGSFGTRTTQLTYGVKPTARGEFVIPPAYAEAMYDRSARARTIAGGRFEVNAAR